MKRCFAVAAVIAWLGGSATAEDHSTAFGAFHDRADRDRALKELDPASEARLRAWAAEHPEAARLLQDSSRNPAAGPFGTNPQERILEQLDQVPEDQVDELRLR